MFKKVSVLVLCLSVFGMGVNDSVVAKRKQRAAARRVKSSVASKTSNNSTVTSTPVNEVVPEQLPPAPVGGQPVPVYDDGMLKSISDKVDAVDAKAAALMKAMENAKKSQEDMEKREKAEQKTEVTKMYSDLQAKIDEAGSACSGIKSNIDRIFGLTTATTVSSGLGMVAAGTALTTGVMKSKADKMASVDGVSDKEFATYVDKLEKLTLEGGTEAELNETLAKKSKILGNIRSIAMGAATAASAVSLGTSIGATLNAGRLADKMEECDRKVSDMRSVKATAEVVAQDSGDTNLINLVQKANNIASKCSGFDKGNISSLRRMMKASAIVSGIGTATAAAGTATSIMANSDKVRNGSEGETSEDTEKRAKKEKGLNLASNVLAAVTVGAAGTSTALSGVSMAKAKKDSGVAEECEKAF